MYSVRLKFVWTEFENIRILMGGGGEIYLEAGQEKTYASMQPQDRTKRWTYKYSFR